MKKSRISLIITILLTLVNLLDGGTLFAADGGAKTSTKFVKVIDTAALSDGDTIIIANQEYGYALSNVQEKNRRKGVKIDFEDGCPIVNADVQRLRLVKSGSLWQLHTSEDSLLCATKSVGNILQTTTKKDAYSTAKIEIDGNSGDANIKFQGTDKYSMVMRFSATVEAFLCYVTEYSVEPLQIYRKTDVVNSIELEGNGGANNSPTIAANMGGTIESVVLRRTFVADGGWYTLCLPFDVAADEIAELLGGAIVEEFCGTDNGEDGVAVLSFRQVESMEAGMPYLVKFATDVANPTFHDKTFTAAEPRSVTRTTPSGAVYTFIGTFDAVAFQEAACLFLSTNGGHRFAIPRLGSVLYPTRAYMKISGTETEAKVQFDAATAVGRIQTDSHSERNAADAYTINGMRIGRNTPLGGIYIEHGRKVLRR